MKVLVADDDAAVRKSLSKVLKDAGYEVILAKNGQEAVAEFNPRLIDLMILDLNLPIQDGWEAFERITSEAPALPIIITTTGEAHQYDIAMAAGVGALMEKPLDAPQVAANHARTARRTQGSALAPVVQFRAGRATYPFGQRDMAPTIT